jgi:hypothetical protein
MSVLYKKPATLNLSINDSNISLMGTDSLGPNEAAKAAGIAGGLF